MAGDTSIDMMLNVIPGTLTGIFALNAGLSSINQQFQNMTKSVDNHFGIFEAGIVSASALAIQFGKNAADAFGEYEQGMKIVQAVSGQSKAAIDELGQVANQFSVQYRVDIDQLTEGLQTLGRAGLKSAQEQTEVLESGLNTAKLEGRDLNGVLEELIQNTTLLGGNLKSSNFGEQSEYVNNLLVATSMTAPINTHDISETLKYSGGMLAAAGGTITDEEGRDSQEGKKLIEDYMGTVAAFAQKGVTGSIAGTALRAFFNKPATQDESVTEALGRIHLKPEYLWEEGEETMKPVSEQIGLIQSQMDKLGISQMDRLQIWSKIVGGKMGQQMIKLDSSDIKDITKDIREANSAENLATQSMQTYQATMKQTSEAGQQAFRAFGEHVARFLTPIAKILTPILQALANPIISTSAFMGFLMLLARAWQSLKKIFGGVRAEVGILKAEMKSLIMNQPARRQVMAGQLHGGGTVAGYQQYQATEKMKRDFYESRNQAQATRTIVNETGASASLSVKEVVLALQSIDGRLEHFRKIVTATNNKIKEEIMAMNRLIQNGVKTTSTQMSTQYTKAFTQSSNSFNTRMNQNIRSSASRMKSEFQAVLNSLTYTPKIKPTQMAVAAGLTQQKVDTKSPSYMFLQGAQKDAHKAEAIYQKRLNDLEQRRSNVVLSRQVDSSTTKASSQMDRLKKHKSNIEKELDNVGKRINAQSKIIEEADAKLKTNFGSLTAEQKEELAVKKSLAEQERMSLLDKKMLLEEELGYKKQEIQIQLSIIQSLRELKARIDNERLSLLKGKGTTGAKGVGVLPTVFPGTALSNVPKEFLPNYSVSKGGVSYSRWNLPSGYGPNTKVAENFTNEQKVQREKILAERNNIKTILAKNRANERNAVLTEEYNARMSASLMNPATGAALNRMFGGSYTQEALLRAHLSTMAFNPAGGAMSWGMYTRGKDGSYAYNGMTEITVAELKALNQALIQNTIALEKRTAATTTMYGGRERTSAYGSTFSQGALAEREAQHLRTQLDRITRDGSYMGYAHIGYGSRSSAEEALNWARYRQATDGQPRYVGANYTDDSIKVNPAAAGDRNAAGLKALMGEELSKQEQEMTGLIKKNAKNSISSRMSSFWNASGAKNITKGLKNSFKGLSGAVGSVTSFMGGPFFAALMAIDVAMQVWNHYQQEYTKKLEEATQALDEAISKQEEAVQVFYEGQHEEGKVEITGWNEENPDATAEEKEDALLGAYSDIYDNSTKGLGALDANTRQLAIATEEVKQAGDKVAGTYLDESFLSANGFFADADSNRIASGNIGINSLFEPTSPMVDKYGNKTDYMGKNYFKTGEIVLSDRQKSEDYPWLKEFAPVLSSNVWSTGETQKGLRGLLGNAGYHALDDQLSSTGGWNNSAWTRHGYNIANTFGSDKEQNKLQMAFKNYGPDFVKLSKQMRRFEKATGTTAMKALRNQRQKTPNMKKALKNLSVQDPKLVSYIKSLAIKTGMTEQQVLMAAQLQQLQEMQTIAKDQVTPRMESLVTSAFQTVAYGGQTLGTVQGSGEGAVSAAQNAAAIAALLNAELENKLDEQSYQKYVNDMTAQGVAPDQRKYKTQEDWAAAVDAARNDGKDTWIDKYAADKYKAYAATNYMMWNPNLSEADAAKRAEEWYNSLGPDVKSSAIHDTLRKGARTALTNQILDAYDAGLDEEEGSGSGGGGGSGSGSGDKDKDKDSGTRKERVDLVLCNRKTIPKLNVNLFKKPPSFTILNKNFKLRDVRINSEDKPKAIMAAIKNSFIDIQKRTDPKIIQDEDAVYDPAAATDGTNVPSGSAKTNTS